MTKEDASLLTLKLFGRYPSAPRDETTVLAWTEELNHRFSKERSSDVERLALGCCRAKTGPFAPSLDEVCTYVTTQLRREQHRDALPEPEISQEEAKSIVEFWTAEADRMIGEAGKGNTVPLGWGPLDMMRLYYRRKAAGIRCGRTRWGKIGTPYGTDAVVCAEVLDEWVTRLPLGEEELEEDRAIIRQVDQERREKRVRR